MNVSSEHFINETWSHIGADLRGPGGPGFRPIEARCQLALTFDHVVISRRHASNCLPAIACRKQKDSHARRQKLPGSTNCKAKTQTDRFPIPGKRPATPRTKPRYEVAGRRWRETERNNALLRAEKVYSGRCGWEGAFVSSEEVVSR